MARPKAKIDPDEVLKLASIGCKVKEIADWFGVTDDTIINRFSEQLHKGRANLKMSVRRWQLEAAKNGNATMLVWLGKQMLGQTDTIEVSVQDARELPDLSDEDVVRLACD